MLSDILSCVYMVYRMAFVSDYCANTFYVWQGFLLRGPVLWAIPALTLVHAAALLERTMATRYAETYERRGKGLGIATMAFMWILGTAINYIVFAVDDVFEELPYCFVTVPKNQERIRLMLTALLPVELLITVGDIGLWWVNRRDLKTTVYKAYSLSKSFQQSENYLTSRLVMPISLAHSSFYWVFLTVTSVYRSSHGYDGEPKAFVAGVIYVNNILLIGLNVCVIVYLCCLRKMDNERRVREIEQGPRKNTEIYFKMLNTQINTSHKIDFQKFGMNATVLCGESEEYRVYLPLRASEAVSAGLCIPAFVMLVYTAVTRKERVITSSLHFNFKLLLYNIWLIVACQVLSGVLSSCYMLVHSTFSSQHCSNLLFTVWQCFLIRGPVLWAIPAITLAHAAALLERTLATRYSGDYEKRGKSVGIMTMISMWILGAVIDYNIFAVDNVFGKLAYCNATVPENQGRVRKMLTCLLPIELLITAGDIGLWICYTDYTLSKSFQQSENYLTSRLVLPISLVHSSFYMVYLAVTSSFRSSFGYDSDPKAFMVGISLVNGILTIGLAICIITYLWCLRKMENDRRLRELEHGSKKNTEIYFKMLNSQIK
ncbi:unnamed protein product [Bursaphelenchus xylophilus]|uniref:(pine wood nematode) hypothetical protein n=1 Tax=Bursaphelenchus xylophilus TaxID=6326 RepID=A0A811LKH8_BURXY|nr:unnamed protein product [Bursaphelenchus xylophilus]CAG9118651.1 unnamed protein product [Bursaphelenchus xylophilus]